MRAVDDTRRRFMTHFASIGLGTTLAPGIIWARMQDGGAKKITVEMVADAMKHAFNRPRPTVVPHLRVVYTTSFPSGHAMESAIVYLTLGAILMRVAQTRVTKIYCLGIAILLTALAGGSRVLPGVY